MADLEAWQGGRAAATLKFPSSSRPWGQTIPWHWFGGVAAVLVLAIVGFLFRDKLFKPTTARAPAGPVVSLAILPFRNASGDPGLDWYSSSIAEMLTTDVGQSASLRTVSPDRVHQILNDLHMTGNVQFDPTTLRQVSESGNADTVISGQFVRFGDQIRIDASLQDLRRDRRIPLKIEAANEKDIPNAVDRLAELIRQNLSVSSDVIKELQAQSFRPSSNSLEALRSYNDGLELARQGNNLEALKRFQSSVQQDPEFALAYAKLGQTYASLGYDDEADQASRKAVDLSSTTCLPANAISSLPAMPASSTTIRRRSSTTATWPRFRPRTPTSSSLWAAFTRAPVHTIRRESISIMCCSAIRNISMLCWKSRASKSRAAMLPKASSTSTAPTAWQRSATTRRKRRPACT